MKLLKNNFSLYQKTEESLGVITGNLGVITGNLGVITGNLGVITGNRPPKKQPIKSCTTTIYSDGIFLISIIGFISLIVGAGSLRSPALQYENCGKRESQSTRVPLAHVAVYFSSPGYKIYSKLQNR